MLQPPGRGVTRSGTWGETRVPQFCLPSFVRSGCLVYGGAVSGMSVLPQTPPMRRGLGSRLSRCGTRLAGSEVSRAGAALGLRHRRAEPTIELRLVCRCHSTKSLPLHEVVGSTFLVFVLDYHDTNREHHGMAELSLGFSGLALEGTEPASLRTEAY